MQKKMTYSVGCNSILRPMGVGRKQKKTYDDCIYSVELVFVR